MTRALAALALVFLSFALGYLKGRYRREVPRQRLSQHELAELEAKAGYGKFMKESK
jgi:hypothetical protein